MKEDDKMDPLQGIRILDFTQFFSGQTATLMMSDFGAEVIKLEHPPLGDPTRYGNIMIHEGSSFFATRNRGGKSVIIDMKDEKQKELFLKLVKTADAVVENFKPGTMEAFGITYEVLEAINPRIVYTSLSGYGQEGPYSQRPAHGPAIQAESGIMSITGSAGGKPVKCGASIAGYTSGLMTCIGTLMGIVDAQRTGHRRRVDISMLDTLLFLQNNQLSEYILTRALPKPNGNHFPHSSLVGDFRCKDGVSIMLQIATDSQFRNFADVMGQSQWLGMPEFSTMAARRANYEKLDEEVQRVFSHMDSHDIIAGLVAKHLPYGRINDYEAVINHPQVKFRHSFVDAVYPNRTTFTVPGNPIRMSGTSLKAAYPIVALGMNTVEILSEVENPVTVVRLMQPILEESAKQVKSMFQKNIKHS